MWHQDQPPALPSSSQSQSIFTWEYKRSKLLQSGQIDKAIYLFLGQKLSLWLRGADPHLNCKPLWRSQRRRKDRITHQGVETLLYLFFLSHSVITDYNCENKGKKGLFISQNWPHFISFSRNMLLEWTVHISDCFKSTRFRFSLALDWTVHVSDHFKVFSFAPRLL